MMNKYQKALNDLYEEPWDMMPREESLKLLQELVDRATPFNIKILSNSWLEEWGVCECGNEIDYDDEIKFCSKCGKALDWSKDE